MSGISKATFSFEARPQIKIKGEKVPFKMMDVGGKSMMGVDLGNDTIARLKSMPGGKYDIELIHKSGKELSEMNIRVTGGMLSRMRTTDGNSIEAGTGRGGHVSLNRDFVSGFIAGGQKLPRSGDGGDRLAARLDQRLQTMDSINAQLENPGLSSKERGKLEKEREVVEKEIHRAMDRQDGIGVPKDRPRTSTTPPTLSSDIAISLDDDHQPPKSVHSPPRSQDIEIVPDSHEDAPKDIMSMTPQIPLPQIPLPKTPQEKAEKLSDNIEKSQSRQSKERKDIDAEIRHLSGYSETRKHGALGLHNVIARYANLYEQQEASGRPNLELEGVRKTLQSSFYGADLDKDFAKLHDLIKSTVNTQKEISRDQRELANLNLTTHRED